MHQSNWSDTQHLLKISVNLLVSTGLVPVDTKHTFDSIMVLIYCIAPLCYKLKEICHEYFIYVILFKNPAPANWAKYSVNSLYSLLP